MSKVSAVYAVNNYTWKLLESNAVMSKINNQIPIVPSSMKASYASQANPFIVYGFSRGTTRDMYFWEQEVLAYTIWAGSPFKVTDIITVLNHGLGRQDESAADVNAWTSAQGNSYDHIHFTNMAITAVQGPGPETTEAGKVDGLVVVSYSFVARRDSILTRWP